MGERDVGGRPDDGRPLGHLGVQTVLERGSDGESGLRAPEGLGERGRVEQIARHDLRSGRRQRPGPPAAGITHHGPYGTARLQQGGDHRATLTTGRAEHCCRHEAFLHGVSLIERHGSMLTRGR